MTVMIYGPTELDAPLAAPLPKEHDCDGNVTCNHIGGHSGKCPAVGGAAHSGGRAQSWSLTSTAPSTRGIR